MAPNRDTERMIDDLGRTLGVPWTPQEREDAIREARGLVPLMDLIWDHPLPDPVGGWRLVES